MLKDFSNLITKKNLFILLGLTVLNFIFIFILGSLIKVVAYYDPLFIPISKLRIAQFLLLFFPVLGEFYAIKRIQVDKVNVLILVLSSLVAGFFSGIIPLASVMWLHSHIFILNYPSLNLGSILHWDYLHMGEYLVDVHKINYFYMDLAGSIAFDLVYSFLFWSISLFIILETSINLLRNKSRFHF